MAGTLLAGVGFIAASTVPATAAQVSTRLSFAPAAGPLSPPAVPPAGKAYLGAWVLPNGAGPYAGDTRVETELANLGEFQAAIGRPLGLVHVYQNWNQPASNSVLDAISSTGAVPIVDWDCTVGTGPAGSTTRITSGTFDTLIRQYAQQLKAYGKPVFLRWLWEPNLDQLGAKGGCIHTVGNTLAQDGANYTAAWQHIWNIFRGAGGVGATNVAFVWNPGLAGSISTTALSAFWPGYQYVDWIGIDGYSRPGKQQTTCTTPIVANANFAQMFAATGCTNLYTTLSGSQFAASGPTGKPTLPIMIGETGATNPTSSPNHQRDYLEGKSGGILEDFQANEFPDIKAICYYDGTNAELGENGTWTLATQVAPGGSAPSGFGAFATLGATKSFSFLDPG